MTPIVTHQERCRIPSSAIGAKVGFSSTSANGHDHTVPAATNAAIHMPGFPNRNTPSDQNQQKQASVSAQPHSGGRCRVMQNTSSPIGMAHHRKGGSHRNGMNSANAIGGERDGGCWGGEGPPDREGGGGVPRAGGGRAASPRPWGVGGGGSGPP